MANVSLPGSAPRRHRKFAVRADGSAQLARVQEQRRVIVEACGSAVYTAAAGTRAFIASAMPAVESAA